jgi:hypothetical protein
MQLKTVVLYLKHRVRPETLLAIKEAEPGELIGVEDSELAAFMPIAVFVPADNELVTAAKKSEKSKPARPSTSTSRNVA